MFNMDCYPSVVNSIFWGNIAEAGAQIYNDSSSPTVTYSDIEGGYTGVGNINANPRFIRLPDPDADGTWGTLDEYFADLHLLIPSPAIDAGSNTAVPPGVTTDLDGDPRILNDVVDMGADEFGLKVIFLTIIQR